MLKYAQTTVHLPCQKVHRTNRAVSVIVSDNNLALIECQQVNKQRDNRNPRQLEGQLAAGFRTLVICLP